MIKARDGYTLAEKSKQTRSLGKANIETVNPNQQEYLLVESTDDKLGGKAKVIYAINPVTTIKENGVEYFVFRNEDVIAWLQK